MEGYRSAEMINNFDIAVGIKSRFKNASSRLSQEQIFGENVILSDLLELKPFAINNTVYVHFHEGFFTYISSDTLATL